MLFSQRKGYKKIKEILQKESIDKELRNGLWNALQVCVWDLIKYDDINYSSRTIKNSNLYHLICNYWKDYFKLPLDEMSKRFSEVLEFIRDYYFKCKWYEVYDFIEFTAKTLPTKNKWNVLFAEYCNRVLEKEKSAYRFIDITIVEVISEVEVQEIKDVLKNTDKFAGAHEHVNVALKFLSDRKKPDYRNSIKESISAVESICKIISNDPKAELGSALKIIGKKEIIHPALKEGFTKLYGYTSDGDGIRHALLEESNLSFTDAKFMLVTCSAFINYLIGKVSDLKIKIIT